jgi:hypothetical protein
MSLVEKKLSPSRFAKIFDLIRGQGDYSNSKASDYKNPSSLTGHKRSLYSHSEKVNLLRTIVPAATNKSKPVEAASIMSLVKETANRIGKNRSENIKILQMAPEVFQAAESIIIPSILSPNDLSDSLLNIVIDLEDEVATPDKRDKIREIILDHFNNELDVSSKLFDWIYEARYKSGAKCLLTIPTSEMDAQFNTPDNFNLSSKKVSMESLHTKFNTIEDETLFGLSDTKTGFSLENFKTDFKIGDHQSFTRSIALEMASLYTYLESLKSEKSEKKKPHKPNYNSQKIDDKLLSTLFTDVVGLESMKVIDNPDILKKDYFQKKNIYAKANKGVGDKYKNSVMLSLGQASEDAENMDHPLLIEVATEAVIPIGMPNSKKDHIGYIILLDEKGYPLNVSDKDPNHAEALDQRISESAKRSPFNDLFAAYGIDDIKASIAGSKGKSDAMFNVYQNIVEYHLKTKFKKSGFGDVEPAMMSSIYRHLFSRYLEGRQTKLLYVPKEFLQYIAFEYNEDGTGKSILDKFKFILALRITTLVANTMGALNDSINRKTINVTFPENASSGDALQLLSEIEREATRKETFGISYDPDTVVRGIGQKSLTVKAENLPGLQGFSTSHDSTPRQSVRIDSDLNDDLKNLTILMQGVPPAAMNNLSDAEFSRSVATMNILFARMIKTQQKPFIRHISKWIQKYLMFDGILKKKIMVVLDESFTKENSPTDSKEIPSSETGTVEDVKSTDKERAFNMKYVDVVKSVRMLLPEPTVAPSISQFNNLNEFLNSATTIFNNIYADELVSSNSELTDTLRSIKAQMLSTAIRDHIQTLGFGDEFIVPDLADLRNHDITDVHQVITNLKAHMDRIQKLTAPVSSEASGDLGNDSSF